MDNPLQFVAGVALAALAIMVAQYALHQYRLFKAAHETAGLERDYLRERIALVAEQRRLEREKNESSWNGLRKFRIADRQNESADVVSLYLAPHDGKPLPPFQPGQYLTFQVNVPGQPKPIVRCYSLSDRPGIPERYRVSVKRVKDGLVSNHFHDKLRVGDIVDVKAPAGQFCYDLQRQTPAVFIAGGIGVTPLLSMVNALVESGARQDLWFFFGVANGSEHLWKAHLNQLSVRCPSLRLHVCYSRPTDEDRAATPPAFQHAERVTVDLLKRVLPSNQFEFYLCGPPAMMSDLTSGLKTWEVPENRILLEAFGAATVRKPALQQHDTTTFNYKVRFNRAGRSCGWHADAGSLLDLAHQNGVAIDSGCRAGNCGTCLVAILEGEVTYLREPGITVEHGSCLTCVSVPKTALTLDA